GFGSAERGRGSAAVVRGAGCEIPRVEMAADDNDLFRILRAANFADHVSGWNRAVGDAILHVDLEPHRFPAINVALDLILILGSHADHGNVVVSVEPERASVRQVHSFGFSAALPADDGYCAR